MSSTTYNAFRHKEWKAAGLKNYEDFADMVEYVNQSPDYGDSLCGEWWYEDEETLTIYSGSFGNDHSPGASSYTYANVYDSKVNYEKAVKEWEAEPEYDTECEQEDEYDPPSEYDDYHDNPAHDNEGRWMP